MDPKNISSQPKTQDTATVGRTTLPVVEVNDSSAHEAIEAIVSRNVPAQPDKATKGLGAVSALGGMMRIGKGLVGGVASMVTTAASAAGSLISYAGNATKRLAIEYAMDPGAEAHQKLKSDVASINADTPALVDDLGGVAYNGLENAVANTARNGQVGGSFNSYGDILKSQALAIGLGELKEHKDIVKHSITTLIYKILRDLSTQDEVLAAHGARTPEEFLERCSAVLVKEMEKCLSDVGEIELTADSEDKEERLKMYFGAIAQHMLKVLFPNAENDQGLPLALSVAMSGVMGMGGSWDKAARFLADQMNEVYHIFINLKNHDTAALDACPGSRDVLMLVRDIVYGGVKNLGPANRNERALAKNLINLENVRPETNAILNNVVKNIIAEDVPAEDKEAYAKLWQFVHQFLTIGITRIGSDIFKGDNGEQAIEKIKRHVHEIIEIAKMLVLEVNALNESSVEDLTTMFNEIASEDNAFLSERARISVLANPEEKKQAIIKVMKERAITEKTQEMLTVVLPQEKLRVALPKMVPTSLVWNIITDVVKNTLTSSLIDKVPEVIEKGAVAEQNLNDEFSIYLKDGMAALDAILVGITQNPAATVIPGNPLLDAITKHVVSQAANPENIESEVVDLVKKYVRGAGAIVLKHLTGSKNEDAAERFSELSSAMLTSARSATEEVTNFLNMSVAERRGYLTHFYNTYQEDIYEGAISIREQRAVIEAAPEVNKVELENALVKKIILGKGRKEVLDVLLPPALLKNILPSFVNSELIQKIAGSVVDKLLVELYDQSSLLDEFLVEANKVIQKHPELNALVESANKQIFDSQEKAVVGSEPVAAFGRFLKMFMTSATTKPGSVEAKSWDFIKHTGESIIKILIAYHLEPTDAHPTVEARATYLVEEMTKILELGYIALRDAPNDQARNEIATEFAKQLLNFVLNDELSAAILPASLRPLKETLLVPALKTLLLKGNDYFVESNESAAVYREALGNVDEFIPFDIKNIARRVVERAVEKGNAPTPLLDNKILNAMAKKILVGDTTSQEAIEQFVNNVVTLIVGNISQTSPEIFTDKQFVLRTIVSQLHAFNHRGEQESHIPAELRNDPAAFATHVTDKLMSVLLGDANSLPIPADVRAKVWTLIRDNVQTRIQKVVEQSSTSENRQQNLLEAASGWVKGLKSDLGIVRSRPGAMAAAEPAPAEKLTGQELKIKLKKTLSQGIRLQVRSFIKGVFTKVFGRAAPSVQTVFKVIFFPVVIAFEFVALKLSNRIANKVIDYLEDPTLDTAVQENFWQLMQQLEHPLPATPVENLAKESRDEFCELLKRTRVVPNFMSKWVGNMVADKLNQRVANRSLLGIVAENI